MDGQLEESTEGAGMRILVTGSEGYVGSALVPFLKTLGHRVDRNPRPGDYRMFDRDVISRFDAIVHLAAHSSVKKCNDDERGAVDNNVTGVVHLMDCLKPSQTLIYASSASVYNGCGFNAKEDFKCVHPMSVYDVTKFAADQVVAVRNRPRTFGLRFGTVSGWSPNTRFDLVVNAMVRDAQNTGKIRLQNGLATRTILGVSDLCFAIGRILGNVDSPHGVYNVGSVQMNIATIARTVAEMFNAEVEENLTPTPHYDWGMNLDKIRNVFGFEPRQTVESICRTFIDGTI